MTLLIPGATPRICEIVKSGRAKSKGCCAYIELQLSMRVFYQTSHASTSIFQKFHFISFPEELQCFKRFTEKL
jgi:hypothetical protein